VTGKMIQIHQIIFHAKNGSAVERSQWSKLTTN
jgi:hypothetical protein